MAKSKQSLKERMAKKKEQLKSRGNGKSGVIFIKEGTLRVRVLPTGDENDFVFEATQFYLGPDLKGVFSPATFGEPCAIMEAYEELKNSDSPEDKELAKKFVPKKKYLMPVIVYKDLKGNELNTDDSGKLIQLTAGLYQAIIDYYLDEDEWGDMTDVKEGYDLKLTRSGQGMLDTEYTCQPCKNSPLPKEYIKKGDVDLVAQVRSLIPSYEETKIIIDNFLNISPEADDDDAPRGKNKKSGKSNKSTDKKKKKRRDI